MLGPRSIPQRLIFSLLLLLLSDTLAYAKESSPWLELHSTHYTVITDAGEKRGQEVALRFEQMRAVFANLLGRDRLNQPVPITILALKNDKSYYQAAPLQDGQPINAPGFFVPGEDQDYFVLNLFEPDAWRAVAHDFAHMYLDDNYPPAQAWFDEGLAEYFSSIRIDDKTVQMGSDPELSPSVRQDLLQNQQVNHAPKSLTELLGAQVWMSIPDLFTMKHDTSGFKEGTHHTLFYAESWMVIHYLIHEKKLPETGTYLGLVMGQQLPIDEAMQKAYGMSPDQFEQAVKNYFHSLGALQDALADARAKTVDPSNPTNNAQINSFPVPIGAGDSAIISNNLSEDDAQAIYADVQVRLPDRREVGRRELQRLATTPVAPPPAPKFPRIGHSDEQQTITNAVGNEIAHRSLAWDDIAHAQFDEALTELGDSATLKQNDMWIRYYLSVLKYHVAVAKHSDIQGLANMMQDLRAVLDWYPEFADAYDLLAIARNAGGIPREAMLSERAALQLSPRNQVYQYHMAEIYISAKNWDAATALLQKLQSSNNPEVAAKSKERLSELASQKKYGIAAVLGNSPKLEPQKSPFDVLDQDAAKRAAAENGSQEETIADERATRFLRGQLVSVDCSHPPAAILKVTGNGLTLKLRSADYKSMVVIGADEFSCDWRDRRVDVNYKSSGGDEGDLVSLEVH